MSFRVVDLMVTSLPTDGGEAEMDCTAATCTCTATGWESETDGGLGVENDLADLQGELREALR